MLRFMDIWSRKLKPPLVGLRMFWKGSIRLESIFMMRQMIQMTWWMNVGKNSLQRSKSITLIEVVFIMQISLVCISKSFPMVYMFTQTRKKDSVSETDENERQIANNDYDMNSCWQQEMCSCSGRESQDAKIHEPTKFLVQWNCNSMVDQ